MDSNIKMQIGKQLKKIRRKNGLTQEKLSEKADVSINVIQKLETGRGLPGLDTIIKICNVLNIGVDVLIYGEDKLNNALIVNDYTKKLEALDIDKVSIIHDIISYSIECLESNDINNDDDR